MVVIRVLFSGIFLLDLVLRVTFFSWELFSFILFSWRFRNCFILQMV